MTCTSADEQESGGPITLSIDIGGTKMKAGKVDSGGTLIGAPVIASTPRPAPPEAVLRAVGEMVAGIAGFDRISIAFPGIVRGTKVITAPNLGTAQWNNFDMVAAVSSAYGKPVRILNDAAVQGLGVVRGPGLDTVITLGTGVGCAVYRNRRWLLHLELGFDAEIGNEALRSIGAEAWNERLREKIRYVARLTACDRLYIGGGNARKVAGELPETLELVSNDAGLTGGVRLWEAELDDLLGSVPVLER
ncbi:MAG: ROK family protein [Hyphomicrobiaceae bacterium]|nr:ROK family protein [Hyphomicrobiaceae bacterium]